MSAQTLCSRESYESGGWKDGRLGQAYDLLRGVLEERGEKVWKNPLLAQIEALDEPHSVECPARYERNDDCTCGYTATGKVSA